MNTPRRKERSVQLVFRPSEQAVHCAGVDALLLVPGDNALYTGSRDSTIKKWMPEQAGMVCTQSCEGHTDWVNSLAEFQGTLFSCSNDRTVRVWDHQGQLAHTLNHHTDYVTCIATAKHQPWLVTAGLRGGLYLINVQTGEKQLLRPQPAKHAHGGANSVLAYTQEDSAVALKKKASIYALAINEAGTLLAAGSSDSIVRVWDTRIRNKVAKLRGHTDNVRCLQLNQDGTLLLSGSADGTIKKWDLRHARCQQTYAVHSDSVRSIAASADWSVVYSGGRDRCLYRTHLLNRTAQLIAVEQHPITCIATDQQDSSVWVGTSSSTVHRWAVSEEPITPSSTAQGKAFAAGSRLRPSSASQCGSGPCGPTLDAKCSARVPLAAAPATVIPGLPAIVCHKVLCDRRHVLCKDNQGNVSLWDVLAGRAVHQYGPVDMEVQERALFNASCSPPWFTGDNRLGQLAITLEPPSCFDAEEYAQGLGDPSAPEDLRQNLGRLLIECAFARWRHMILLRHPQHSESQQGEAALANGAGGTLHSSSRAAGGRPPPWWPHVYPAFWQGPCPAVIWQNAQGVSRRLLLSAFTGGEPEPEDLPAWVGDIVLRGVPVTPKESKVAFIVLPSEGSTLPQLLQHKLNAPRILQVHKVAGYCLAKLRELQVELMPHPVYLSKAAQQVVQPQPNGHMLPELELLCNGLAVPHEMSLLAVKKYIWCKPEDLVLHYRVRDPKHPAPVPHIQAPKAS